MTDSPDLKWRKLGSEAGADIPLFKLRIDTMQHPASRDEFRRMVLEAPAWVTVVAVTSNDEIIMVEQYRFGVGELTLEPVAGTVDPGEETLVAAKRELLEETGYGGGEWRYLGSVQTNPAIFDNLCHHWLVEGVERVQEPTPDEGEALRVHLLSLAELRAAISDGRLRHSLGLSALSRVFPLWELPYTPEG
jgi:8-oxo-dGTP pyrophosphatase MutT (NUDIX family)